MGRGKPIGDSFHSGRAAYQVAPPAGTAALLECLSAGGPRARAGRTCLELVGRVAIVSPAARGEAKGPPACVWVRETGCLGAGAEEALEELSHPGSPCPESQPPLSAADVTVEEGAAPQRPLLWLPRLCAQPPAAAPPTGPGRTTQPPRNHCLATVEAALNNRGSGLDFRRRTLFHPSPRGGLQGNGPDNCEKKRWLLALPSSSPATAKDLEGNSASNRNRTSFTFGLTSTRHRPYDIVKWTHLSKPEINPTC